MNILDKLQIFLFPRNYKSDKKVTRFTKEIAKNGEFIKNDEFYIYIKMKEFVYRFWRCNFPYAFLKNCDYTNSIDYFGDNYFLQWNTFWLERMPSRNAIIKFCERFNPYISDVKNTIEEIDQYCFDQNKR